MILVRRAVYMVGVFTKEIVKMFQGFRMINDSVCT
jgi:hypothetical protein